MFIEGIAFWAGSLMLALYALLRPLDTPSNPKPLLPRPDRSGAQK